MATPGSHRILFGLRYCSIAVNLWNFCQITKWDSPEGWPMLIRPTLRSLLIATAFIKLIWQLFASLALHCTVTESRRRKVLSCVKPKPEKSFCAQNAEGGQILLCGKPKARYDLPVLKSRRQPKKSPVARNAEGLKTPVEQNVEGIGIN